jgi:hypothetical protein
LGDEATPQQSSASYEREDDYMMQTLKAAFVTATCLLTFGFLAGSTKTADAQISIGVNIGGEPSCPYGYYDYAPYNCAPYGYYGPEWFVGGRFLGAGQWFHGPRGFNGHVDHNFDPRYGYHGGFPAHGAYHAPPDHFKNFHGSDTHNGHDYVKAPPRPQQNSGHEEHGGGHDNHHQ